jgi:proteasome alpha subunit
MDEEGFTVLGGEAEALAERMKAGFSAGLALTAAVQVAVAALAGPDRKLSERELEVAVLERGSQRRTFRRIDGDALTALLG